MAGPFDLTGKRCVVTGASQGIGSAVAVALARAGADVAFDYRSATAEAERTAAAIEEAGREAVVLQGDTGDPEHVEALADRAVEAWGGIDVWVNNAARLMVKPFLEMDPATYHKVIEVDQHSVYYGMYYAAKKMVALGAKGTFVNTASIYGTTASVGSFNYNAAKAAVIMMTRSAALELAPHGIRVAAVAPGFINTPILGKDEAMKAALAKQHLHNKLIEPEQVASVVAFLFTDGASAINGSTIPVEDGFQIFKNS